MDHSSRSADLDSPVVVLTAARSGSTLLRLLLDAHPDLACPAETSILRTCSQLASSWEAVYGDEFSASHRERMNSSIRGMLDALYGPYLTERGKAQWCDKSLGTAMIADSFVDLYPRAKFICLYRHAMDVIYSAIEASPWGMTGYGFDRFSVLSGGNNIYAAASYWADQVSQIMAFERRHPERCLRINYERLVQVIPMRSPTRYSPSLMSSQSRESRSSASVTSSAWATAQATTRSHPPGPSPPSP